MRRSASLVVIAGIMLVSAIVSIGARYIGSDGRAWRGAIAGDGVGYTAYLSTLIVNGSFSQPIAQPAHLTPTPSGHVIKYTAGTAILQAPFYLLASTHALFADRPEDPRSLHFQIAVGLAAWSCMVLGLLALRSVLLRLGIPEPVCALVLCITFFGTGLSWYCVMEPSMSHTYGFAAVAFFLWAAQRAACRSRFGDLALAAAAFGLSILVRPVDVVALLAVPLVLHPIHPEPVHQLRRPAHWRMAACVLGLAPVLAVQALLWYAQCGISWTTPYAGEGFHWYHPMAWNSLFGAQKGLFFYWPLLLLSAPGLLLVARKNIRAGMAALVWAATLVYLTSAWWCWTYGDSYGARPYVDQLSVFAVLLTAPLRWSHRKWPVPTIVITVACMLLQCFQAWQYHAGILQPQSMDLEKYRFVLGRSGERYRNALGGCSEPAPYAPCGMSGLFEGRSGQYRDGVAWSPTEWEREGQGAFAEAMDTVRRTSVRFTFGGAPYPTGRPVFVEYAVTRSERIPGASDHARVVCAIAYIDGAQAEFTYLLNHVPNPPAGPVRNWASSFVLPPDPPVRSIQLYVRNEGDGAFQLGEPHVRISTPAPCDDADGTVVGPAGFEPATNGL